ncbi:MAG: hypothetical protein ACXAC5_04050 [Promethearchaeota archaeon]|jgi:hypothetical protein
MSFEGYYQILCRNGHIGGADCYDDPNFDGSEKQTFYDGGEEYDHPRWRCPECKELAGWWNLVDITNGSYYEDERIDGYVELEIATEPDVCTCNCGYVHPKGGELATYKIPEKGGHIVNDHAEPSGSGELNEDERKALEEGGFDLGNDHGQTQSSEGDGGKA